MNAIPPSFTGAAEPAFRSGTIGATAMRWTALTEAAAVVAVLADISPTLDPAPNIAALLEMSDPVRRERAENGVADIAAFMETGIAALLSITARSGNPRHAAQALWHEFANARASVISLLGPAV